MSQKCRVADKHKNRLLYQVLRPNSFERRKKMKKIGHRICKIHKWLMRIIFILSCQKLWELLLLNLAWMNKRNDIILGILMKNKNQSIKRSKQNKRIFLQLFINQTGILRVQAWEALMNKVLLVQQLL